MASTYSRFPLKQYTHDAQYPCNSHEHNAQQIPYQGTNLTFDKKKDDVINQKTINKNLVSASGELTSGEKPNEKHRKTVKHSQAKVPAYPSRNVKEKSKPMSSSDLPKRQLRIQQEEPKRSITSQNFSLDKISNNTHINFPKDLHQQSLQRIARSNSASSRSQLDLSSSNSTDSDETTADTYKSSFNELGEKTTKKDNPLDLEQNAQGIQERSRKSARNISLRCLFREDGGFSMLDSCVVLADDGSLGAWTGFKWKRRRQVSGWNISAVTHDTNGNLWSLNQSGELAQLTSRGWTSVGLIGNRELKDITFDLHKRLWGITRKGDIGIWNGYTWSEKHVARFKKTTCISCDRLGNIWVLSSSQEIAKWDQHLREWDIKILPPGLKPQAIAFDSYNCLWGVMTDGQLAQISGNQWIFLGYVNGWHYKDITFRWN